MQFQSENLRLERALTQAQSVQRRLLLKEAAPFLIHPVRWARLAFSFAKHPKASWEIARATRGKVLRGPFTGLRMPSLSDTYSSLLGTYEQALIPTIESVIARDPDLVVDVGAAYGFYTFGFAKRLPKARHVAYELDITRLNLLKRFRALNGVENRVDLRGKCTQEDLSAVLEQAKAPFVLVDIEGGEASLLDPNLVPGLTRAELLIELHEMFVPGVTHLLQQRFAETHSQNLIFNGAPCALELDSLGLSGCAPSEIAEMIDERREGQMAWLHLKPTKTC
jgi:hypothetical protein